MDPAGLHVVQVEGERPVTGVALSVRADQSGAQGLGGEIGNELDRRLCGHGSPLHR